MGKKPCPICKKLLTNVKRHLENKKKCEPSKEISNEIVENLPIIEPEESEEIKNLPIVEVEVIKEYIDEESNIEIKNGEGLEYLNGIADNTIDLILTDPPYIISNEKTGMNQHYIDVKHNLKKLSKTEKEWNEFWKKHVKNNKIDEKDAKVLKQKEKQKQNYLKYGTIYGKKFAVKTDYGQWDKDFTIEELEQFIKIFYKKLKKGGTCIIFFDLWKITDLKNLLDKYKFKQIRFIEWIKTNPQPLNSSRNYLTNCREIALTAIKGGKPTFNSKYDKGIYEFPLQGGKNRFHPTQKSLKLFEALIEKHSKKGDLIVDTFLGGGTTAIASKNTGRKFKGCEISK
jgi:site-specific DNA-methyltransferase (adenine-specific)